ncbi:hypothetical protein GHNINEIG_00964 [Hydrogenovibrio crunogenus]|uniref:Uncharacterized protein n=1 Tax=Hydrogenovibrio crunogenus TaxID=39765 RepID=A0A4P7NYT3_9GAMM|nr:hypothetical protein [Hydrogenovibrio crunogenus]QBZ82923.1 hypothetical protein GHNINEIG_00964 [Hydrogenovibrio crunogenus]
MKKPIIVIGMGELGSVFARGFLKLGYPVQPVNRSQSMQDIADEIPDPAAVLIAVGEADIHQTLQECPAVWADNLILLQNELLKRDWENTHVTDPTVISVWFEKKKGMDSKVVLPSPVYGQHSKLVFNALSQLDLPCVQLDSQAELTYELVRKNLYILTTNIAGLVVGGNVESLMNQHKDIMNAVADEVLDIQDALTEQQNDRTKLMKGLIEAFEGDLEHKCMGRSAPARLKRALEHAETLNINVPYLHKIAQTHT